MNVEQFTNKVKEQISAAQIKALQKQHQQLLSLHMLSVLLEEKDIVVPLLQQTGTNLSTLQNDIDKEIEKIPTVIQQDKTNIFKYFFFCQKATSWGIFYLLNFIILSFVYFSHASVQG